MTYKELKKRGTKIHEYDMRDNGIYYGTTEEWICDGSWYQHIYRDNTFYYHGKEKETIYAGTLKELEKNYKDYAYGQSELIPCLADPDAEGDYKKIMQAIQSYHEGKNGK